MARPEIRLRTIDLAAAAGRRAPALLVMLAGAYDAPEQFVENGFAAAWRERAPALDLSFLATELEAVADGRMSAMLHDQVITPARAAGYPRILLGGISIGAQIALIHCDDYPGAVDGLVLIAPYPGNRQITAEVSRGGGLMAWEPGELAAAQGELRAWRSLRNSATGEGPPPWLGFGEQDRFADAHRMMAAALAPGASLGLPGGHDWSTWRGLWDAFLERRAAP